MASYIIIGGDQKEYGPITADDVRQWIAEGRLGAQSRMKAEGDAEWRPLSAFGTKRPAHRRPLRVRPIGRNAITIWTSAVASVAAGNC